MLGLSNERSLLGKKLSTMKLTSHHLLPKSKGGSGIKENREDLSEDYHRAFHKVFQNDTPSEQIIRLLTLNNNCLQ